MNSPEDSSFPIPAANVTKLHTPELTRCSVRITDYMEDNNMGSETYKSV